MGADGWAGASGAMLVGGGWCGGWDCGWGHRLITCLCCGILHPICRRPSGAPLAPPCLTPSYLPQVSAMFVTSLPDYLEELLASQLPLHSLPCPFPLHHSNHPSIPPTGFPPRRQAPYYSLP